MAQLGRHCWTDQVVLLMVLLVVLLVVAVLALRLLQGVVALLVCSLVSLPAPSRSFQLQTTR